MFNIIFKNILVTSFITTVLEKETLHIELLVIWLWSVILLTITF